MSYWVKFYNKKHIIGDTYQNKDKYWLNPILEKKLVVFDRLRGPGGLHNIGNMIALFGGLIIFSATSWHELTIYQTLRTYFLGNVGTVSLTISMIIFLIAGECYYQACKFNNKPNQNLLRKGDFLSAIAAVISILALMSFGQTDIALFAGALLVIGKMGTAIFPKHNDKKHGVLGITSLFRKISIISRVPSIIALAYTAIEGLGTAYYTNEFSISIMMLVCYVLWLVGDIMLLNLDQL